MIRMHLPTYVFLTVFAVAFNAQQVFAVWGENEILLFARIFVFGITSGLAVLHFFETDDWQLRWAILYVIPSALLVLGFFAEFTAAQDRLLGEIGLESLQTNFPGTRADYVETVRTHFLAMTFPFVARGISIVTRNLLAKLGLPR